MQLWSVMFIDAITWTFYTPFANQISDRISICLLSDGNSDQVFKCNKLYPYLCMGAITMSENNLRNKDPAKMSWAELERSAKVVQKTHIDAGLPPSYLTAWMIYTFAEGTGNRKDVKNKMNELRVMVLNAKQKKHDEVIEPYRPTEML